MSIIPTRLESLRQEMRQEHIDAIILLSADPHGSEYVASHWQARQWISGFTGSAGTIVVTMDEAALWTDSRYFLQAEEQLRGTGIQLMKEGIAATPSITDWLLRKLSATNARTLAIDGMVMAHDDVVKMQTAMRRIGVSIRTNYDAMRMLWRDRPAVPHGEVYPVAQEYVGETTEHKINRIREVMRQNRCEGHVITDLMAIAWVLNMRGCDISMTPVFIAHLWIASESILFTDAILTNTARQQLDEAGIVLRPYADFTPFLRKQGNCRIMADSHTTPYSIYEIVKEWAVDMPSPAIDFKAIKNDREIAALKEAMLIDGVAMVRFLRWLKPAVEAGGQTEISVSDKLEMLRRESPLCRDLSFSTISGYNAHGAIVHYSATPDSNVPLRPEGLLLIDSGAQYTCGTTDITRTIALGPVTDEMRRVYTYVLKANIALATTPFPEGINGTQLDAVARSVVWRGGYHYLHGTGHGVGWCLCVHEGPHSIRLDWRPEALRTGMTVTDEPGIYLAGKFGVRTENMMLVSEAPDASSDGETAFLRLVPLTLCPIDTTPIDRMLMTDDEIAWLNEYHAEVRRQLLPLLTDEGDRQWLINATDQI